MSFDYDSLCSFLMKFLLSRSRTSGSSRSISRSPPRKRSKFNSPSRKYKKEKYRDLDEHHSALTKEKRSHKRKRHMRSRSLSRSRSPQRHSGSKSASNKKYYKEKRRSYTPEKTHHSRKHRNGNRDSPIRERYDKHRRWWQDVIV